MSFWSFGALPPWAMVLSLVMHLTVGVGLGVLYFRSLWWSARQFASGARATTTIAFTAGRIILLGGLLALASLEGAPPLLATALGALIARSAIMRRVREGAS